MLYFQLAGVTKLICLHRIFSVASTEHPFRFLSTRNQPTRDQEEMRGLKVNQENSHLEAGNLKGNGRWWVESLKKNKKTGYLKLVEHFLVHINDLSFCEYASPLYCVTQMCVSMSV